MSDIFDFTSFVAEHPELSWALQETENSERSSTLSTSRSTVVTVIHKPPSAGSNSSSSDSLMKLLLQPPPSKGVLEPLQESNLSSKSPSHVASQENGDSNEHEEEKPVAPTMAEDEEEPVAPTMSPSMAVRHLPRADITPEFNSNSSSSDSLMKLLLQPPPSKRVLAPLQERNLPSKSSSHVASQDSKSSSHFNIRLMVSPSQSKRVSKPLQDKTSSSEKLSETSFQEEASAHQPAQELDTEFHGDSSSSSEDSTSLTSQQDIGSPSKHNENILGDLDAKSALFLWKHVRSSKLQRTTDIDPYSVGLLKMQEVLRDGSRLSKRLREDEEALGLLKRPCVCDISEHPSRWTDRHIQDVHNYSFLLECEDLTLKKYKMLAANKLHSLVVYKVPMEHKNPMKLKAEQVLRFVDVEMGFGDETCYDLFHYSQPSNRMILVLVSRGRVVGIVVAEELQFAHRILHETVKFMELEEHPVPVRLGINRLWVHISMRRQHLATLLCKLVGMHFNGNRTLPREDYAFNNISDSMVAFAKVFLKDLKPPLYCRLK